MTSEEIWELRRNQWTFHKYNTERKCARVCVGEDVTEGQEDSTQWAGISMIYYIQVD